MRISVVIPALNEESCLAAAVRSARRQRPHEILVADGGSTDGTRQAAFGADLFLEAPRGRARQMNAAAAQATSDVLLFLHADCTLEDGALEEAERCLQLPGVVAGCFRQTVTAAGWPYRAIDRAAGLRARFTGIVYGDQGLFLKRATFEQCGGFPDLALMEDLFLSLRLRRHGKVAVASKRIFVSPRRWRQAGVVRQTLRNWGLTALAAAGVPSDRLVRFHPAVR